MIDSGPVLDKITFKFSDESEFEKYPLNLKIIQNLKEIVFKKQVTFFVGENGTGKSTILEALAEYIGFGKDGGSKNLYLMRALDDEESDVRGLTKSISLSWRKKVDGYFFKAESFWNIANKLKEMAGHAGSFDVYRHYGGKSLHEQSHGESFLAFFKNRVERGGIYIFDEPEAALSPQRQLALLKIIFELSKSPETQFIIATHSPILLAYPDSEIYSCDGGVLKKINYKDTEHFQITKNFLNNPEQYFKHLFN